MPAEIKSKGVKVETVVSASLQKKFKKYCIKSNTSMSQRLRDLIQKDLKG